MDAGRHGQTPADTQVAEEWDFEYRIFAWYFDVFSGLPTSVPTRWRTAPALRRPRQSRIKTRHKSWRKSRRKRDPGLWVGAAMIPRSESIAVTRRDLRLSNPTTSVTSLRSNSRWVRMCARTRVEFGMSPPMRSSSLAQSRMRLRKADGCMSSAMNFT